MNFLSHVLVIVALSNRVLQAKLVQEDKGVQRYVTINASFPGYIKAPQPWNIFGCIYFGCLMIKCGFFSLSLFQGPRGARGARGPTGKPGPKVDDSVMDGQNIQETLKRIVVNSSQTNYDFEQYLIVGKIFECFGKMDWWWLLLRLTGHIREWRSSRAAWWESKSMMHESDPTRFSSTVLLILDFLIRQPLFLLKNNVWAGRKIPAHMI